MHFGLSVSKLVHSGLKSSVFSVFLPYFALQYARESQKRLFSPFVVSSSHKAAMYQSRVCVSCCITYTLRRFTSLRLRGSSIPLE